jgi:hypothetical protein
VSTPNEAPVTIEVSEKDKPFILALVASGITIMTVLMTAVGAYQGKADLVQAGMDMLKFTFTLTTAAWVYYFGKQ